MISPLFTAFALIATGQVQLPPSASQAALAPETRPAKADRAAPRR
jgi:hypothetical protein